MRPDASDVGVVRSRESAALDHARLVLLRIVQNTYEKEARDEARGALRRIEDILRA